MCLLHLLALCVLHGAALVKSIQLIQTTTLGPDPQTVNHLNGESFQQDALVTINGEYISLL